MSNLQNNNISLIESQNKFYNYIYLDPNKPGKYQYVGLPFSLLYEPFYIGKGCGNRKYIHLKISKKENTLKATKIKSLYKKSDYLTLKTFIIQFNEKLTKEESITNEIEFIKIIGRKDLKKGPLCNMTDGGEGCYNLSPLILEKMKNRKYSPETILKFKERSSGNNNPQSKHYLINVKGLSEEEAILYLKQKAAKSAEKQKGRTLSEERKQKMSQDLKGKTYEERHGLEKAKELKQNRSDSQKGKSWEERYGEEKSKELKQLYSEKAKNRIISKESIEKRKNTIKERGSLSGDKNPAAKHYIVINHDTKEEIHLIGKITQYINEHKLNFNIIKQFLNKGKIGENEIKLLMSSVYHNQFNRMLKTYNEKYLNMEFILI